MLEAVAQVGGVELLQDKRCGGERRVSIWVGMPVCQSAWWR